MRTFSDRTLVRTEQLRRKQRTQRLLQRIWKQITLKRLLFAAIGIPLAVYLFTEARRHIIVLDPIVVPRRLADSGLTSEVMTQRVREKLEEIQRADEFASSRDQLAMQGDRTVPDIEIPETKLSLRMLSDVLRKLLRNEEKHLSGEITSPDASGKAEIRSRVLRSGELVQAGRPRKLDTTDPDQAADFLARDLTELTDPYLLGIYLKDNKEFDAASEVANHMLYAQSDTNHIYAKAHILRGFIASATNRVDEAIREDQAAIDLDHPEWAYSRFCLAVVFQDQHRLEDAAREYRQVIKTNETGIKYWLAIQRDPNFAIPHDNLGNVLVEQHNLNEAAAEYHRALQIDPKDAYSHNGLGNILDEQHNLKAAMAEYQTAIHLDPKNTDSHSGLGNVLDDQHNLKEAMAEYQRAILLDPKDADPHSGLGNILEEQNKLNEAAVEFQIAIQLDPKYAVSHSGLGNVLEEQNKPDEAAAEFQMAIELDPKYAVPHNGLGNVLDDKHKLNEAAVEYQTAIRLDPKYAFPHNGLGILLEEQNKPDEAVVEFQKAIQLEPTYAVPYNNLGKLLKEQGKPDQAARQFKAAHNLDPARF